MPIRDGKLRMVTVRFSCEEFELFRSACLDDGSNFSDFARNTIKKMIEADSFVAHATIDERMTHLEDKMFSLDREITRLVEVAKGWLFVNPTSNAPTDDSARAAFSA